MLTQIRTSLLSLSHVVSDHSLLYVSDHTSEVQAQLLPHSTISFAWTVNGKQPIFINCISPKIDPASSSFLFLQLPLLYVSPCSLVYFLVSSTACISFSVLSYFFTIPYSLFSGSRAANKDTDDESYLLVLLIGY